MEQEVGNIFIPIFPSANDGIMYIGYSKSLLTRRPGEEKENSYVFFVETFRNRKKG